jgi:hypothetical protein
MNGESNGETNAEKGKPPTWHLQGLQGVCNTLTVRGQASRSD